MLLFWWVLGKIPVALWWLIPLFTLQCYPLLGYFLDRRPNLLDKFWIAVPSLISFTYFSYLLVS